MAKLGYTTIFSQFKKGDNAPCCIAANAASHGCRRDKPERMAHGSGANFVSGSREDGLLRNRPLRRRTSEPDKPDRLLIRSATGAGYSRDAHGDVGARKPPHTLRHLCGAFGRHRANRFERLARNAKNALLHGIGVTHDAP